jgi:hypothetical protein
MIYLIDTKFEQDSHSAYIIDILKQHTDVEIELIEIPEDPTYGQLHRIINELMPRVFPKDIVLCPWAVDGNELLDEHFNTLSELCWVVVAAGNFDQNIKDWTPARAEQVITVACLNKSGVKAALSNWSEDKELVWVPGTNYNVGWKNNSGTSVSAAIYSAFLAKSIKEKDFTLLDRLLEEHKNKVLNELNK